MSIKPDYEAVIERLRQKISAATTFKDAIMQYLKSPAGPGWYNMPLEVKVWLGTLEIDIAAWGSEVEAILAEMD